MGPKSTSEVQGKSAFYWRTLGWAAAALLAATVVFSFSLLVFPGTALAKSYSVSRLYIRASVNSEGSVDVVETRTFSFKGEYSWVIQDLSLSGSSGISDIRVYEKEAPYVVGDFGPGTYSYRQVGNNMEVTWRFSALDEAKTFSIAYRIEGAVVAHTDVAELYWNFVGDEWEVPSSNVLVELNLPRQTSVSSADALPDSLRAWGHGPLSGEVNIISPEKITWSVPHLPAGEALTVRATFPRELVPLASRSSDREALGAILEEEENRAVKANRARLTNLAVAVISPLTFILSILGVIGFHLRWGKEYEPQFEGDYYRELPGEYTPAELGCLWNFGAVGAQEISATILDLARKGFLEIEATIWEEKRLGGLLGTKTSTKYVLKRTRVHTVQLHDHEKLLLDYLFDVISESKDALPLDQLKTHAQREPSSMQRFVSSFGAHVKAGKTAHAFFDHETERVRTWEIFVGIFVMMGGLALLVFSGSATAVLIFLGGLPLLLGGVFLRRRSPMGSTHLAKWKAFRRFLLDFSSLDKAEIPSLVVWEHYLVYAAVLGVAKQVLGQLRIVYPDITRSGPGMYHGWMWMHAYGPSGAVNQLSTADLITGITDSLRVSVSAAVNYRPSSGSGVGGGFSGGAGGGGGGGGGRAG